MTETFKNFGDVLAPLSCNTLANILLDSCCLSVGNVLFLSFVKVDENGNEEGAVDVVDVADGTDVVD